MFAVYVIHVTLALPMQEAVRWLLSGKMLLDSNNPMMDYNYCGSNGWTGRERQQFRRAWKVHRKQFNLLRSAVSTSQLAL